MPPREWSNSEKKIARRAYETARHAILGRTLADFKAKAAAATTIDHVWSIVDAFHQRGREPDEMLDYRYSQLTLVFARLVAEGVLDESQLDGLSQDKIDEVRWDVELFRKG